VAGASTGAGGRGAGCQSTCSATAAWRAALRCGLGNTAHQRHGRTQGGARWQEKEAATLLTGEEGGRAWWSGSAVDRRQLRRWVSKLREVSNAVLELRDGTAREEAVPRSPSGNGCGNLRGGSTTVVEEERHDDMAPVVELGTGLRL
jgi:hypothetical protein